MSSELEKSFSCCVCWDLMDTAAKVPVILVPCGHSVCKACIDHLSRRSCPICRQSYSNQVDNVVLRNAIQDWLKQIEETNASRNTRKTIASKLELVERRFSLLQSKQNEIDSQEKSLTQKINIKEQVCSRLIVEKESLEAELKVLSDQIHEQVGELDNLKDSLRLVSVQKSKISSLIQSVSSELQKQRFLSDNN
ncbi:hypothetical protein RCL1_002663 [Eukaryota sp. TZLM3-RCL]